MDSDHPEFFMKHGFNTTQDSTATPNLMNTDDSVLAVAETSDGSVKNPCFSFYEGRLEAQAKKVRLGRKPTLNREKMAELRDQGMSRTDIACEMQVSLASIHRILGPQTEEEKVAIRRARGEVKEEKVKELYAQKGMTGPQIAHEMQTSCRVVYKILGPLMDARKAAKKKKVEELYVQKGMTGPQIAHEMQMSRGVVYKILGPLVDARKAVHRAAKAAKKKKIVTLYAQGMRVGKIAHKLQMCWQAVSNVLGSQEEREAAVQAIRMEKVAELKARGMDASQIDREMQIWGSKFRG